MNLTELVAQTKDLLPNPQVLPQLLSVLENDHTSAADVVNLLKVDPGLTAKIISMSNSAFFGFSEPCSDLNEAVGRIGFQELYKLVSLCLCRSVGDKSVHNYYLDEGALWENAVTTAMVMEDLADHFGLRRGLSYTVGLLHSLGKFVINQLDGDVYEAVYSEIDKQHLSLIDAEKHVLGFDHAQACNALLSSWDYPDEVRIPILYQYMPAAAKEHVKLTYCLHFTKFILTSIGCHFGRAAMAVELDARTLDILQIPEAELNVYILRAHEQLENIRTVLDAVQKN